MSFLRKFNTALNATTALRVSLRKAGSGTYATGADWAPAANQVWVSVDGGAEQSIETAGGALPTYLFGSWVILLTAARLGGKQTRIRISAPPLDDWDDTVETFGDPAAFWPDNWSTQLLPSALAAGGKMDASVGAIGPGAINSLSLDPAVYATIADSVWDEPISDHVSGSGSTGAALGAAAGGGSGGGSEHSGYWQFDASIIMADPGAGDMRLNDVPGTETAIVLSRLTDGGTDATAVLRELLEGDIIYFQDQNDAGIWSRYLLLGPPADQGGSPGWWMLPVAIVERQGTPANNQVMLVNFRQAAPALVSLTPAERNAIADAIFARPLPADPSVDTAGEAFLAARAGAIGRLEIVGDTLILYAADATTPLWQFTLAPDAVAPTSRTPI